MKNTIQLSYYSDVLCVWAYIAQIRLDELRNKFGTKLKIEHHFISVFGCTEQRIGQGWKNRGSYDGFSKHVADVAKDFPHISINPEIWRSCIPKTSMISHCFLKAVQLMERNQQISTTVDFEHGQDIFETLIWKVRCAFFEQAQDIGDLAVLYQIAESIGLPVTKIERLIHDGSAMAALSVDQKQRETNQITGSPSYLLDNGRQKLYGNVGYRVIEANVLELLENSDKQQASWC